MKSHSDLQGPAIVCRDVVKQFYLYSHRTVSLRERFISTIRRQSIDPHFADFSLQNFNICVQRGESIALVGRNGSGKSTVLRVLARVYEISSGSVETNGRIAAVIELGSGLSKELTGAENIELYSTILGVSRTELTENFNSIIEFSELGDFIEMPVKYYSSGMVARLAFSVAVNSRPDILLLDEVLSVGDSPFRAKCLDRLREFRAQGVTMVIVSHGGELLKELCTRAVWIEGGQIRQAGEVTEVLAAYLEEDNKQGSSA